ncbi:MAG TPA: 3-isopropylmalate dehydrogenase [Terracidiphilus sp.]|nr:3-isopropylmalate dehydrogenase [Terracidiphilus sp.]
MQLKILVTPGDGIGPEITEQAIAVLREVAALGGHKLELDYRRIGGVAIDQDGTPLPADTLAAALDSDAVFLGAVGDDKFDSLPPGKRPEAGLLQLRAALGGFANLRPIFAFKELSANSPLRAEITEGADILFVRELLGGLYFGQPREWNKETGEAWNTMRYTRDEVARVARISFQLAQRRRKHLTSVDKANVLEVSQMWRATVTEVAREFPDVTVEHQFVDAMSMHLMKRPRDFDVVVTENTFGDILTDEASVITGSLGMLPSGTIGGKIDLYEPGHGSAPKHAGKNIANPLATILTGAMLLRHSFGLEAEADAIVRAVRKVLEQGFRTQDLARTNPEGLTVLGTREMGEKVRETVKEQLLAASR